MIIDGSHTPFNGSTDIPSDGVSRTQSVTAPHAGQNDRGTSVARTRARHSRNVRGDSAATLHGRSAPSARRESPNTGTTSIADLARIVTPDTLPAWLIAKMYDGSTGRGPGRLPVMAEIRALIVHMATDNRNWGYTRIQRALAGSITRR